jgi:hypothetical protein
MVEKFSPAPAARSPNPDIILSKDLVQSLINSEDAFPVDFDDAWGWLGYARKENGLRSLKKYFYSGQDFNLLQVEEVQNSGDGFSSSGPPP